MPKNEKLSEELNKKIARENAEGSFVNRAYDEGKILRRHAEEETLSAWQTPFIQDIDKIMHCPYFSRYADKTQVYSPPFSMDLAFSKSFKGIPSSDNACDFILIPYRMGGGVGQQTVHKFLDAAFRPAVTEISLEGEAICTVFQIFGLQVRNLAGNALGQGVDDLHSGNHIPGVHHIAPATTLETQQKLLQQLEKGEGQDHQNGACQGDRVIAAADRKTQARHYPKAGGSGQTFDTDTVTQNGACA